MNKASELSMLELLDLLNEVTVEIDDRTDWLIENDESIDWIDKHANNAYYLIDSCVRELNCANERMMDFKKSKGGEGYKNGNDNI